MTNINILNNKLEKLNLQMLQTKDINNISLHQFLKQKNNMAVNIATTVLKGYRELQYNYRFIRNNLKSKNSVKYLHTILEQANQRIIDSSNFGNTHINSNDFDNLHINSDAINNLHVNPNDISKKELNFNNSIKNKFPKISFRESLKPENFNSTPQNLSQHSKPIKKITLENIYLTK